jgi:general secretion pathway protein D
LVGRQVSVASTSYPNNAGGTTTASPFTTFNRVNVALHLYVRPQITRGQGIQMQIDQGNDTLDPLSAIDNTTNPTFRISSIVTSVHVESNDIIVLGGLIQDGLGNDNNGLPILKGIPGLGRLFQHNIRTRDKRVLMVFIKPVILRNERDNLQVTGSKYNNVRQYQLDWLRSQEIYEQNNNETVLPPLTQMPLPRPFTHPPTPVPKMTK